jgi:hypothetical protein
MIEDHPQSNDEEFRDLVRLWCEDHQAYDITPRLNYVPIADIRKHVIFHSVDDVRKWLDKNGY